MLNKMKTKRTLALQVIATAVAFVAMGLLSLWFASGIVRSHLAKIAEDTVIIAQERLESNLGAAEMMLDAFAETLHIAVTNKRDNSVRGTI